MNIYQKLLEVRKAVPFLQKDTEGSQYKYNSSSQVLGAVRAKLDEMNLLLITEITGKTLHGETIEYIENAGKPNEKPKKTTTYLTEIDLLFTWVNTDKPEEQIKITWYSQGVDIAGEKGVGKALTYAEKTFMLKEFNIPTDKMDVDVFQNMLEKSAAKIASLQSNSIALIKTEWLGLGYKINTINEQTQKLYSCKLIDLTEEQANDFLGKLKELKKGGKAS